MRLLLVEDEEDAARMLAKGLREQTYAVDIARDGIDALEKLAVNTYDLVILDIMLPGRDGLEVCGDMRRNGMVTPVLMLTAQDQVFNRIRGLDSGADDYLTKPFHFGELSARVRALLRRGPALQNPLIEVADLQIDTRRRIVKRGARTIDLTAKEYALLEFLCKRQGDVIGRAEISEHVWDETYDAFSNLIEVYIQRLRRKVDAPGEPRLIHTRRGEGYRLTSRDTDD